MSKSDEWWSGYTQGGLDYQRFGRPRQGPDSLPIVPEAQRGGDYESGYHQGWDDAKHNRDYPILESSD